MPATPLSAPRFWTGDTVVTPPSPGWIMHTPESADQFYLREAFRWPPNRRGAGLEAFSKAWFERMEHDRYSRPGRWLPHVLEFGRHAGETLIGLGNCLGTDWLQYAKNGAHVAVCCETHEQLDLVERHFQLRGGTAQFRHAPAHALPFDAASIDVVCVHGLIDQRQRANAVIDEIYRVLRPGGKVIAVAPAFYNAGYWQQAVFPWMRWFSRTPDLGLTARGLRRDFARFVDHIVKKRHLRRSQLPQVWRLFPLPLLERFLGQFLIVKAFKPLSAALSAPVAA